MANTRMDIVAVARLARLALSANEIAEYGPQLENLLGHVDELSALDTANVAATAQVIESRNVVRDDVVRPGLTRDAALACAPQAQLGYFRVPKIIAEAE
jgi:aspartyl-tRNA(Asn)/glutamyl-tRNA(Gln) amidotransferase subunit C